MLSGYKTYITAALAILTAVGGWLAGDVALGDMLQMVFTAAMAAFLRSGIAAKLDGKAE